MSEGNSREAVEFLFPHTFTADWFKEASLLEFEKAYEPCNGSVDGVAD